MVYTGLLSTLAKIAAGSLLVLILCSAVLGQGSTPQRGFQPGGSYALGDIETINTTNGNLSLHLPLGSLPAGRGGLSGQLNLHYDSKIYDSKTQWYQDLEHLEFGNPHVAIRNILVKSNEGGWHYGAGYELQLIDRMDQYPPEIAPHYPAQETIYHYKLRVVFPDGSAHEFMPRAGSQIDQGYSDIRPDGYQSRFNGSSVQDFPYLTNNVTYYTFDGTYVRLEVQHDSDSNWFNNPWTLYFPDGTKVTNLGKRITDRNGNYVEFSGITYNGHLATQLMDQLGRKIIVEYGGVSDGELIHVPGVGGVDLTYQVHWKSIQVFKTYSTVADDHFSPTGYPDMLGSQSVVSRIDLPAATGGLQYVFGYNAADYGSTPCCTPSYGWGELSSITTPTGAQVQYQYHLDGQNGPGFDYRWDQILRNQVTQKTLTYQQQYDGNSTPVSETWTYTGEAGISSVTNPDGGVLTQLNDAQRNYRTEQPDGTVIEKLWAANRSQNFTSSPAFDEYTGTDAYDPQRVNGYVKTEFISIKNASGALTKTAIKDYNYDKNGNVTRVAEYDWVDYGTVPRAGGLPTGIPAGAVVKRVTTNTLALFTPDASDYTSSHANSYWNATAPSLRNAVAATEVSNGSATLSRTEFTYDNAATTGNPTQQKSWDSTKGALSNPLTGSNSISVSTQYDSYGNPTLSTDARGYQTQFVYGSVGGFTDLYPTQIKTAYQTSVQRTETREYDFSTGAVTRTTDVDNNVSNATLYDVFGRPTLVKAAEGKPEETRTSTSYSDVNRRMIVKSDLNTLGDEKLVSIQHYDQLGRVRLTRQLEDAATENATDETTGIKVQTRYQYSGNFSYVLTSNQYRAATSASAGSEATMGWSRSKADKGGRVLEMQTFSGASAPAPWGTNTSNTGTVLTAYDANSTIVTDQAGKARKSVTDALGRLTEVYEDPAGLNYQTSYLYDSLDNLVRVTQSSQQRFFMYDSLKRLIRADNPEQETLNALSINDPVTSHSNWSAKYDYDNNGNLTFKTDARNVVTENRYDELNRLTTVLYRINGQPDPNTGDIQYVYDNATYGKGRLWLTYRWGAKPSHTAVGEYDALGRVKQLWNLFGDGQGGWSAGYGVSRNYNLAGQVRSETYPSGRTVNYGYDSAGRTSSVNGNLGDGVTRSYASSFVYNARSQVTQELFGTQTPLYHKLQYNVRGQLWDVRVSTNPDVNGSMNRGGLQYFYDSSLGYGTTGPDNNGNVVLANIYTPEDEQGAYWAITPQRYDYDSLNRLKSVTEYFVNYAHPESQQFVQTYDYDRWGNRTINAAQTSGNAINNTAFEVESARNRLYSPGDLAPQLPEDQRRIRYDKAGNQIKDTYTGYGTATFDGDNRIVAIQDRFASSSTYTYNANAQRVRRTINNQETWQIYGIDGELVAEYAANGARGTPQKEYGYRSGELLITAEAPNRTNVALSANGGTATASSYLGAPYNYYASYVNDGQRTAANGNIWLDNTYQSFPDWVEIDFNGTKTINEIDVVTQQDSNGTPVEPTLAMTFASWGVTAFEVQYWNGTSWATVPNGTVTGNNKVWRQFTFADVTTSKIRVTVNAGVDNVYSRVVEVEAWTPVSLVRTNYALPASGGSATASSYLGAPYNFYPSYVNDGQRTAAHSNIWLDNTYQSFPDWVEIDFNGTKTINEIDVVTQQDSIKPVEPTLAMTFASWGVTAYEVQYWNGTGWATVPNGSVSGNNKVWRQFTFANITTSKIRVTVNSGVDNVYSRVVEVEAWGDATGSSSANIQWLVPDHLGTPRIILDQTGWFANVKRHDYLPFGEELYAGAGGRTAAMGYVAGDGVRQQFTSKERDSETGLDYFGARYYASVQGRFCSTDPKPVTKESFLNPQRWNLYVYVNNNPLGAVDPNGADGQGKSGDKVISVFLDFSLKDLGRRVTTDRVTRKVTKDVPNTTDWQGTAAAAPDGYRVEVFGNPDVTGEKGLPQRVTDAAFNNALKNSEVVIYAGHGRGDPATAPFVQQGIQAGNTYYTPTGTTGAIQTAVVPEGTQTSATGPKPDTQAAVVVNLSCNANRNGGAYFNFAGNGQVMVTMNSNWNGVTSFDALDKAANAFVKTYMDTGGNVQKAIDAANKVLQRIPGENKENVGDRVEATKVN